MLGMIVRCADSVPFLPGLRKLRLGAALSQDDLARKAGMSASSVSDLERQITQARPSTMRKLADALNCQPRELMADS